MPLEIRRRKSVRLKQVGPVRISEQPAQIKILWLAQFEIDTILGAHVLNDWQEWQHAG